MEPHQPVLGTAQLGLAYGVANRSGQPDQDTATSIVRQAWQAGIREFDTAQAYGSSEKVLGNALSALGLNSDAKVITKPHPDVDHLDASAFNHAVNRSLETLGVPSIFGLMFHREEVLSLWDKGLSEITGKLVDSGAVQRIGLSVYSPKKAMEALNTKGIDLVQVPSNLLDRRFENLGVFRLALEKKKTVYIRSAFLQGLILMDPGELPHQLEFASEVIEQVTTLAETHRLSRQETALGYLKEEMPAAKIIFGAETPGQVLESMQAWMKSVPPSLTSRVKELFPNVDERILNPTMWTR